jgi:uncharacterized protein (TIGR02246 family)
MNDDPTTARPTLSSPQTLADNQSALAAVVDQLQRGLDQHDADIYNQSFAADVIWGGPFGATVDSYDALHSIHQTLLGNETAGPSRYEVVNVRAPAPNIVLAQVRRRPKDRSADAFAEMALYVLVQHDRRWWLVAGQNTRIEVGRSATDSTT